MKRTGLTAVDLVPLGERMRMISAFRAAAVVVILISWLAVPSTRGVSFQVTAIAGMGYLAATLLVEAIWRRSDAPARFLFGVIAMSDSLFLAWASYGSAGLDTPLRYLVLLQLITVSLLASFRTGLKLAMFNSWLLLCAVYATETGAVDALGGEKVVFGDDAYLRVAVEVIIYFLVTVVTTSFAAINERELRRRRYDLEELARFALGLEQAESPADVAETLLEGVSEIYGCEPSVVVRLEKDGILHSLASRGLLRRVPGEDMEADLKSARFTLQDEAPVIAKAMQDDQTMLVRGAGTQGDKILAEFAPDANVAILPLRGPHGGVVGVMVAEHPARRGSRIERRVLTMMERFASHGSLALENARLLEEVRALSITDPLTGLANRRHLDAVLDRACAQVAKGHGTLSVMMIDIDHFKKLNDTHGHQAGDDVLKLVAKTLERDLRAGDLAARYGGEEFTIVMPGATGPAVEQAAERLRDAITRLPHPIPVTISVGVAWAPVHGIDRETITKAADHALYAAKTGGRNRVALAVVPDLVAARRA
ncbi:MAG: sensor domain-containing diguanylate cyclase [Solirubrobacteraceae bacterium]|nr:sensor domain-containing diguanylate cyclase [Solirubrobacteraceae bacterium]